MENTKAVKNIFSPQIQIFEPFGAHVDPSRSNMSSKQLLQIINSRLSDAPFILNKAYRDFTEIKSPFNLRAPCDGLILDSGNDVLFILYHDINGERLTFEYIPSIKKISAHALHLRYVREVGSFKAGDTLYDYTGQTENGLPKIGYRTNILFGSFLGYTAEDAMVISESYSKRAQCSYAEKIYIPVTKKHKYFKNEKGKYFYSKNDNQSEYLMDYIKIDTSLNLDSHLANISKSEIEYHLKYIKGLEGGKITDVKLHRLNNSPFNELAKEYVYSPDLIKEISEIYSDQYNSYQKMIETYSKLGLTIDVKQLVTQIFFALKSSSKFPSKLLNEIAEEYNILDKEIDFIIELDVCQTVPTVLGDKFANCFAGKGVVSLIIPDHLMPKDPNGNPVDLIFNPLGIYGRNNWACIFELGLSGIIKNIEEDIKRYGTIDNYSGREEEKENFRVETRNLIKDKIKFINDNFIVDFDMEYFDQVNNLLENFEELFESFKNDILKNGLHICVDNFPNIAYEEYYNGFIKVYSELYGTLVNKQKWEFSKDLWEWLVKTRNYTLNVLGPNGEGLKSLNSEGYFGEAYYLKLFHTSYSKYNAVSMARKYNKANGQPARGRKDFGGQHKSWMTVAADRGHSDNSSIDYELSTIKSDCIEDKDKFFLQSVFTGKYHLQQKGYNSKTYEGLNHSLALVGMKFVHQGNVIETSRATEKERISQIDDKIENLNLGHFKSNIEEIYTDFELQAFDLDDLIEKNKESNYIDEMINRKY
jgi:DNA-directed RNA polymerase beta subunit